MSEAIRPDGVYGPDGKPLDGSTSIVRDTITAIPNFVKLLWRLGQDSRVPTGSRILMFSSLAYVLFPIDFLPDVIPGVGQIDDALLIIYAINRVLRSAGPDVLDEHWDGSPNVLNLIQGASDVGATLVPKRLRSLLDRI